MGIDSLYELSILNIVFNIFYNLIFRTSKKRKENNTANRLFPYDGSIRLFSKQADYLLHLFFELYHRIKNAPAQHIITPPMSHAYPPGH